MLKFFLSCRQMSDVKYTLLSDKSTDVLTRLFLAVENKLNHTYCLALLQKSGFQNWEA